jgi:hypothetical protein
MKMWVFIIEAEYGNHYTKLMNDWKAKNKAPAP